MEATEKPQIVRLIKNKTIREDRVFRFATRKCFSPSDGRILYQLEGVVPQWVGIDEKTGIISGKAPKLSHPRQYLITVRAINEHGSVSQSFYLKVVVGDVIEDISERLIEIFSLRKTKFPISPLIPFKHEILEFLFVMYKESEYYEEFIEQMKKHAEELNIQLEKEPTYEDFVKVVKAMNPEVDMNKLLEREFTNAYILRNAELNRYEMMNLFRQGGQPLGVRPIVVWNYMGSPGRYRVGPVNTVLNAAAKAVIKLNRENIALENKKEDYEHNHPTPPSLRPPKT